MATLTKDAILDAIAGMSVLEVSELVKAMEEKFGVSAMPVAAAAPSAPAESGGESAEDSGEEKLFTVILKEADTSKKIPIIKEVRAITGLGLKDAKDLVETAGSTIKEDLPADEAKKIKEQLESAGATIELK